MSGGGQLLPESMLFVNEYVVGCKMFGDMAQYDMLNNLAADARQGNMSVVGWIALIAGLMYMCDKGMLPLSWNNACVEALLE